MTHWYTGGVVQLTLVTQLFNQHSKAPVNFLQTGENGSIASGGRDGRICGYEPAPAALDEASRTPKVMSRLQHQALYRRVIMQFEHCAWPSVSC